MRHLEIVEQSDPFGHIHSSRRTARPHHRLQLKFLKEIPLCIYKYHNQGATMQENWRRQIDKGRLSRHSSSSFGPAQQRAFHNVQNLAKGP
jgi:hypothetical protein